MADDTDTTRPGEAAAAEKAARVLAHGLGWREPAQLHTDAAEEIVAAVYPVIAAAVREQAAQDIEREAEREKDHFPPRWPGDTFWEGVTSGKCRAAGIARDSR